MKSTIQDNANITGNSKQLAILKSNFPECFDKNGVFIASKLQEIVQASGVEVSKESYGINWLGKSYARLLANQNPQTLLKANKAHNELPDNANSQNMLIKGDNLEVLKHLVGAYREQVKMIYIDPPYNTGSDGFVYQDDRKFTVAQLSHLAGIDETEAKRILEFTQSKSNSHSAWLTFMYPRLYIAKQLLKDDGVIFISIDDNEQAQLKILCDEIFGGENFVANVIWHKKYGASNDSKYFSEVHDHILVYCKVKQKWMPNLFGRPDELNAKYKNLDNDSRGDWIATNLSVKTYSKANDYPITGPNNTVFNPPPSRAWVVSEKRYFELLKDNRITFGQNGSTRPYLKTFLSEVQDGIVPTTIWGYNDAGHNIGAKTELRDLFSDTTVPFDTPKPTKLLKRIINVAESSTASNDLVLDFFSGSGTTADAVMQLNAEDGGNRRFICVQIDEKTDPKKEAYKAGFKSIYDITQERIKRAAAKIRADFPLSTSDFGFKQFETIPVFDGYLDEPEELTPNLELFDVTKLSQEDRHNLMLTWQVQDNIPLTQSLTVVDLAGYKAYQGKHILYFIEPDITLSAVIKLLEQLDNNPSFAPRRVVVLGYLLDSKIQREMTEAIKHYNNRKGIELTLDIRF